MRMGEGLLALLGWQCRPMGRPLVLRRVAACRQHASSGLWSWHIASAEWCLHMEAPGPFCRRHSPVCAIAVAHCNVLIADACEKCAALPHEAMVLVHCLACHEHAHHSICRLQLGQSPARSSSWAHPSAPSPT